MKNLFRSFFFLSLILIAFACNSPKPAIVDNNTTTTKTIQETIHDTVFKIEKDSSTYKALLDCENGKVVIKNVSESLPGRNLKSPRVRLTDNNKIQVDCEAKAQELFAKWKSTHEKEVIYKETKFPFKVNELTGWQNFQIWCGRVFLLLLLLLAIVTGFNAYKSFN